MGDTDSITSIDAAKAADKDSHGAAAPEWTGQVVVNLPGRGPETVTLTVDAQGPMTLVWPAFGGVRAGKAVGFAKIETVSNKPAAAGMSARMSAQALRWLRRSGRVDPGSPSRSRSHTEEAAGQRDATIEDVHAMVMAIVDQELSNETSDRPRPAETQSLLTLRDVTGSMLLHNLLLAGAQGKDPRAHKLFLEIVHKVPRLLLDVHDGRLIFHGEGPLHLLAVNGRSTEEAELVEKVAIDCLRTFRKAIAERKISPNELVSPREWVDEEHVRLPHLRRTRSREPAKPQYDEAMHDGKVETNYPCAMSSPCSLHDKAEDQLMRPLLECDAVGPFFEAAPMKYFGGTPIAYFAAFGMKDLLKELVGDPKKIELARQEAEREMSLLTPAQKLRVEQARAKAATWMETTLDGMPMPAPMPGPLAAEQRYYLVNELRSEATGYLPIHAVAASGNRAMYDFMVDICGANPRLETLELSTLKLAVVLGKQAMVAHILKRRTVTAWAWGPVTQYMIPLEEIDTAGARVLYSPERCLGNLQLLELVVAPSAKAVTNQMLTDDFMHGFLFRLILEKWYYNAWFWHHVLASTVLALVACLVGLSTRPSELNEPLGSASCPVKTAAFSFAVIVAAVDVYEELLRTYCLKGRFTWYQLWRGEKWLWDPVAGAKLRLAPCRYIAAILTIVACSMPSSDAAGLDPRRALLAIAIGAASVVAVVEVYLPFEGLGTFINLLWSMLFRSFLPSLFGLYIPLLLAFTTMLTYAWPPGAADGVNGPFGHWTWTLERLTFLAFLGEPLDYGTGDATYPSTAALIISSPEPQEYALFTFFYLLFVVIILIVVVNLLLAMMGHLYDSSVGDATLSWRVDFAQQVLRCEYMNLWLAMCHPDRHERRVTLGKDGAPAFEYTHSPFRSYDEDAQLNLDGEGGDLFADGKGDGNGVEAHAEAVKKLVESNNARFEMLQASIDKVVTAIKETSWQPRKAPLPPPMR